MAIKQNPDAILMVKPSCFGYNQQTAGSNAFQTRTHTLSQEEIRQKAAVEFDALVQKLRVEKINVIVAEDTQKPQKPDAVFPNNWISTHHDGTIVMYPMEAQNRRAERRVDIIDLLRRDFTVSRIIDISYFEKKSMFLEGTGSIVFDHVNKASYACVSSRTDVKIFTYLCAETGYEPFVFEAHDKKGKQIYHTNIMLSAGEYFAVICTEVFKNKQEKKTVMNNLAETGRSIIEITEIQMKHFAGNILEVSDTNGRNVLVMSQTAFNSFDPKQIKNLEQYARIIYSPLDVIEKISGGSARCMLAGIHLKKNDR